MPNLLSSIICTSGVMVLAITVVETYSTEQIRNIAETNMAHLYERDSSGNLAITDLRGLMRRLQAAGLAVKRGGRVSQPFFSVRGSILTLNGEQVQVFEYANTRIAEKDAQKVSATGSGIGMSMPMWIAPPHFYKSGRLIVLYLGESQFVIKALEGELGPQFAGK